MAKNPRKVQDPTQAALSAIEDALQMASEPSATEPAAREKSAPSSLMGTGDEPRRSPRDSMAPSSVPAALGDDHPQTRRRPYPGRRSERVAPANDDRQSVGQVLSALHARPPRMPFVIAAIASIWWMVMALLIGYSRNVDEIAGVTGPLDIIDLPNFWLFFATVVLPPALFFTIAALIRRSQEMRLVSRAMTEVTLRLAEPEGVSTDAVVSVSQAIRREVAALGDGIERAIARASELETMVRNEVATLERAYDENELRVRSLVDELQSERDSIVSHGTRLREAIGGAHENFSLDVEGVAARIDSTLASATQRINAALSDSSERITENFLLQAETVRAQADQASNTVLDSFAVRSSDISENISKVGNEIGNILDSRSAQVLETMNRSAERVTEELNLSMDRVTESIVAKGTEVHNLLVDRLTEAENGIARNGADIADRITHDTTSLARGIADGLQALDQTVKVHATGLLDRVTLTVDKFNEHSHTALSSFDERSEGKLKETTEALDSRIARIQETIDTRAEALNESLATRTLELARTIADGSKVASEAVDKTVAGMGEYFADKAQEIAVTISDRAEAVDQTLGKRALEMTENLDSRVQRFEEQVSNRLVGIVTSIETKGIATADLLADKIVGATAALRHSAAEAEHALTARIENVSNVLRSDTAAFEQALAAKTEKVGKALRDDLNLFDQTLASRAEKISKALRDDASFFDQALAGRSDTIGKTLRNDVAAFDQAISLKIDNIGKILRDDVSVFDQALSAKTGDIGKLLRDNTTQFEQTISAKSDAVSRKLRDDMSFVEQNLGSRVDLASKALLESAGKIEQTLGTKVDGIGRKLKDAAVEAEQILAARSAGFAESIRTDTVSIEMALTELAERVSKTLVDRVSESTANHQTLRNEIVTVIDGIGKAHKLLTNVLDETVVTLKPMESTVVERVTAFQQTLEQAMTATRGVVDHMDNQMRSSRDVSMTIVRDIGALSQRFEEQGRVLSGAAATLGETHRHIDQTLAERRDSIERFAGLLSNRTSELENRLTHFNHLLEESLGNAEARAHEIAKLVADSTSQSTNAIGRQYELVRTTGEEERERTGNMLRLAYQQTMDEVKTMFGDARERFNEAAQDLRSVADEIHEQLEQTRAELKRGVLELPHETRESAEAMRRVVADQLKALSELNDVVSRHAREMEAVEPHRMTSAAGGARFAARGEGASITELPGRPRAAEARGEPIEFRRPRRAGPRAVDATSEGEGEAERASWLSGLLANNDTEDKLPPQTIESLDSLSLDIARMIDHDAAVDLWDRHRRGERGIFTRRLYTAQGQKTFDEIRRRYRKNGEFRETVDRYIDEFERLLEQVSRDDRGQALSRTYLTSDTGKVYTLLAHAAARLN